MLPTLNLRFNWWASCFTLIPPRIKFELSYSKVNNWGLLVFDCKRWFAWTNEILSLFYRVSSLVVRFDVSKWLNFGNFYEFIQVRFKAPRFPVSVASESPDYKVPSLWSISSVFAYSRRSSLALTKIVRLSEFPIKATIIYQILFVFNHLFLLYLLGKSFLLFLRL